MEAEEEKKIPEFDYFLKAPSEATRRVVARVQSQVFSAIQEDMKTYNLRPEYISRGLNSIYALLVCCGPEFAKQKSQLLADCLKVVYKYVLEEEAGHVGRCLKIAGLLGRFQDPNVILPLVVSHLKDKESRNLPRYVSSCLAVLSEVTSNLSAAQLDPHLPDLVQLVASSDYADSESTEVLVCVIRLLKNLIEIGPPSLSDIPIRREVFRLLMLLAALPQTKAYAPQLDALLQTLAEIAGLDESSELVGEELPEELKQLKVSSKHWTGASPERHIFTQLVRRASSRMGETEWRDVVETMAGCFAKDSTKDYEVRQEVLALLLELFQQDLPIGEEVVLDILIPAATWSVGKPNSKIRHASVLCLSQLSERGLIKASFLAEIFKDLLFPPLKSCLDDDWDSPLRFASIVLMRKLLSYLEGCFGPDALELREIYPELLKRMDDSQDNIREKACEALAAFCAMLPEDWSESLFVYIVKSVIIHLDDPSEAIQKAVRDLLLGMARINKSKLVAIAKEQENKFKNSYLVKNLVDQLT